MPTRPDNGLLMAIASHPDCKRLRLTLESLSKWGPTALSDFADKLGIDQSAARAPPDPPARRGRATAVYAVREDDPVSVHDPPDMPLDVPHPWRTWRRRD